MTLPDEIKRLRELEAKATPGNWGSFERNPYSIAREYEIRMPGGGTLLRSTSYGNMAADAELIAETRNALPAILDALEQWQQLREADEKEIHRLRTGYLADENGNEYVAVCILKEKIREQQTQLAEAKEVLEFYADSFEIMDHIDGTYTVRETWYAKARALLEKWGKG